MLQEQMSICYFSTAAGVDILFLFCNTAALSTKGHADTTGPEITGRIHFLPRVS